jgi:hypothetical protein
LTLGTLTLALLGSVLVPSAASAAPGEGPDEGDAEQSQFESGMRLVDFDAQVARAHGFEVVTLPDGSLASVPAAEAESARKGEYIPKSGVVRNETSSSEGVSTLDYGELPGDCGISWVYLEAQGGSTANLGTGMTLIPDAGDPWDVHWKVNISDNGGSSNQTYTEYDGFIGFLSWTAYTRRLGLTPGWAFATVNWWQSYTITENGWVCWSAGPSTSEKIY